MARRDNPQVVRLLRNNKFVEDAVVCSLGGQNGETIVYVTLRRTAVKRHIHNAAESGEGYESQQVELWETVFDDAVYPTIERGTKLEEIGRDFHGWISAYDASLLGNKVMNEWLDDTIGTILSYHGQRELDILELGTGSGMILFNLAKQLHSYLGIELTQAAVDFVTETARSMPELANKVRILQGTATDANLFKSCTANTVIVNSVAQYFPSLDYLFQVVEQVLDLKNVRTIIFGDIRSGALKDEFFVSKALRKLPKDAKKHEVRQKVAEMAGAELELLTEPAFFTGLQDRFPGRIEHVEILPKKLKATNELSCYRYTAVLHVADREQPAANGLKKQILEIRDHDWVDFGQERLDYNTLSQRLASSSEMLAVSNIPYSKIALERYIVDALRNDEAEDVDAGSAWLATAGKKSQDRIALSPVDLVALAQATGHQVELSWARQYTQRGGLDAVFHRQQCSDKVLFRFPTDHQGRAQDELSTHPLEQQARQDIQQDLYDLLQDELPSDIVPDEIVIVDRLPRSGMVEGNTL